MFTAHGEGFFLRSPSEFQRFSVSARFVTQPACAVDVKDGVRPPPPEPEPEPEPEVKEQEAEGAEAVAAAAAEGEGAAEATAAEGA
jgi:lethal(2) giant larvae protein